MNLWEIITCNYVLNVAVTSWFFAQLLKTAFTFFATGKVVLERMVGAGGMPSAHSASTCALVMAVARKLGVSSPEFGIVLAFSAIVMYDAMGVRRAAGEQAKVLNKMIFEIPHFQLFPKPKAAPEQEEPKPEPLINKELKESLGHTPFEVLCGCLLGILVSIFMPVT